MGDVNLFNASAWGVTIPLDSHPYTHPQVLGAINEYVFQRNTKGKVIPLWPIAEKLGVTRESSWDDRIKALKLIDEIARQYRQYEATLTAQLTKITISSKISSKGVISEENEVALGVNEKSLAESVNFTNRTTELGQIMRAAERDGWMGEGTKRIGEEDIQLAQKLINHNREFWVNEFEVLADAKNGALLLVWKKDGRSIVISLRTDWTNIEIDYKGNIPQDRNKKMYPKTVLETRGYLLDGWTTRQIERVITGL